MEKIIIHIGMPKTGSTTIQEYLKENKEELYDKGYFIPSFYGSGVNSWPLTFNFMNENKFQKKCKRLDHLNLSIKLTQDNLKVFYEKQFSDYKDNHSGKILLTSSEDYFGELKSFNEVSKFKYFLSKFFNQVEIILYIRNPLSKAISCLSEDVKKGKVRNEIFKGNNMSIYSYKNLILNWLECFPKANFKLALFQTEDLICNDLISDFLVKIGLFSSYSPFKKKVKNKSLNFKSILILSEINKKISAEGRNLIAKKNLIDLLDTIYLKEPKYHVSSEVCRDYENFFLEEDEWLRENFFREKCKIWDYSEYLINQENRFILDSYDRLLIDNIITKSDLYFKIK